jgi:hypothetical protein
VRRYFGKGQAISRNSARVCIRIHVSEAHLLILNRRTDYQAFIEEKMNYYSEDIRKFWYKPHIFEWYYDEISSFHKYLDIFKSANYAANMIVCSTFSPMIEKKIN